MTQPDLFDKPEKSTKICEHCGAKNVEYRFSFNSGLASCLRKIFEAGGVAKNSMIGLTKSQYTNITKMRHWGLIVPHVNEESIKKRGWWKLTKRGSDFLAGTITIPRFVVTCRGDLVRMETPNIFIGDIDENWKYRDHYAEQARHQLGE